MQIILENLSARGQTLLEGVPIQQPTVVPNGATFTVCDRSFRVEYGACRSFDPKFLFHIGIALFYFLNSTHEIHVGVHYPLYLCLVFR